MLRRSLPHTLLTLALAVAFPADARAQAPASPPDIGPEVGAGPEARFEARLLGRRQVGGRRDGFGSNLALADRRAGVIAVGAGCLGLDQAGYVTLIDASNARQLERFPGPDEGDAFGFGIALGPVRDRDGRPDMWVGSPLAGPGRVALLQAQRGRIAETVVSAHPNAQFGAALISPHDFDGDGRLDVVVGSPAAEGARGRVDVYSGAKLSVLHSIEGKSQGDTFGATLVDVGDFDGDGSPDFAVGAPLGGSRLQNGGYVRVYSGTNYRTLRSAYGTEPMGLFGETIAPLDDLDDDGRRDLLVGAPSERMDSLSDVGAAHVISGRTGVLIRSLRGEGAGDFFGRALATGFDLDGDGVGDFAVGAPQATLAEGAELAGRIVVYSGAEMRELLRIEGSESGARFGASILTWEHEGDVFCAVGAPARGRTLEALDDEGSAQRAVGAIYIYKLREID